jgi:hypothetical protein
MGVTFFVLELSGLAALSVLVPIGGLPFGLFHLWLFESPPAGIYLAVRLARRSSSPTESS